MWIEVKHILSNRHKKYTEYIQGTLSLNRYHSSMIFFCQYQTVFNSGHWFDRSCFKFLFMYKRVTDHAFNNQFRFSYFS